MTCGPHPRPWHGRSPRPCYAWVRGPGRGRGCHDSTGCGWDDRKGQAASTSGAVPSSTAVGDACLPPKGPSPGGSRSSSRNAAHDPQVAQTWGLGARSSAPPTRWRRRPRRSPPRKATLSRVSSLRLAGCPGRPSPCLRLPGLSSMAGTEDSPPRRQRQAA